MNKYKALLKYLNKFKSFKFNRIVLYLKSIVFIFTFVFIIYVLFYNLIDHEMFESILLMLFSLNVLLSISNSVIIFISSSFINQIYYKFVFFTGLESNIYYKYIKINLLINFSLDIVLFFMIYPILIYFNNDSIYINFYHLMVLGIVGCISFYIISLDIFIQNNLSKEVSKATINLSKTREYYGKYKQSYKKLKVFNELSGITNLIVCILITVFMFTFMFWEFNNITIVIYGVSIIVLAVNFYNVHKIREYLLYKYSKIDVA